MRVPLSSNQAVLGTMTQNIMSNVGNHTMSASSILYSTLGGKAQLLHMLQRDVLFLTEELDLRLSAPSTGIDCLGIRSTVK